MTKSNDEFSKDMYSEIIMELWRHPENFGKLKEADIQERGFNESCGDEIEIFIKKNKSKDAIEDASFIGKGCAICMASASLVTEKAKSMKISKILKMDSKEVEKLLGASIHPARIKCMMLPLDTMKKSLQKKLKVK